MKGSENVSARNMMSYQEITAQRDGVKGDSELLVLDDGNRESPLFAVNITAEEDNGSCCLQTPADLEEVSYPTHVSHALFWSTCTHNKAQPPLCSDISTLVI